MNGENDIWCYSIEFPDDKSSKEAWITTQKWWEENDYYLGCSRILAANVPNPGDQTWIVALICEDDETNEHIKEFAKEQGWNLQDAGDETRMAMAQRRLQRYFEREQGGPDRSIVEGLNQAYVFGPKRDK